MAPWGIRQTLAINDPGSSTESRPSADEKDRPGPDLPPAARLVKSLEMDNRPVLRYGSCPGGHNPCLSDPGT